MGLFDWFRVDQEPPVPVTAAAPTAEEIATALDMMDEKVAGSALCSCVVFRVRRITKRLRETLPRMTNTGLTSIEQYSLIATATSYLPQTIGSYVRLPRDWADSRPVDMGRSSLLVLVDQLDLLGETVDKIYDAVLAKDAEALVIHGRFLAEKFTPGQTRLPEPKQPTPQPTSTLDLG
ncbi:MAG: hypothetical protein FWG08_05370 [Propionibacteriaceae bacterium]|nr:hypothetical protein [Propionibacteriaceae bacterium]